MWVNFWNGFTKVTGWPAQKIAFRTKIYYEDKSVQGRKIKGPAIIISNHTSVFDYAVIMFIFFKRTLRYQMAEVLFKKKILGMFLKMLGGIYVDRTGFDFSFMTKSEAVLRRGGVVGIFPEARLPKEGEERPLPFVSSSAFLAMNSGVPVIPLFTDGHYFKNAPASVIIGKPINVSEVIDKNRTEKENINAVLDYMRNKVIELEQKLNEQKEKK